MMEKSDNLKNCTIDRIVRCYCMLLVVRERIPIDEGNFNTLPGIPFDELQRVGVPKDSQ